MFNNLVFDDLYNRFLNKKLAHAYLFNTNDLESLHKDLNVFIKAILCESKYEDNCAKCNICNLIDKGNMPDILYIEPDGLSIKKQQVLDLKTKFLTKPMYVKYNIYIINHCDYLNSSSANSILKFLEEPEENIIGFYVTDNSEKVISTIKSRCEVINVIYKLDENKNNITNNIVDDIINYIINEHQEPIFIYKNLFNGNIEQERKDIIKMFEDYIYEINNYFMNKSSNENIKSLTNKVDNKTIIEILTNAIKKLNANVNIEMFIIDFAVELRNLYE